MATPQYEIGRVAERCAGTGQPLNPGDLYVAALFDAESGDGLDRRDYSAAAWDTVPRPHRLFACWRAEVPQPNKSGKPVIDAASLLGLFEQLAETDDPKRLAFRYVLALLLLRKRYLLPAGMRPGVLLVRMKGSPIEDPPLEVIDPAMDDDAVAGITEQLRQVLRIEP